MNQPTQVDEVLAFWFGDLDEDGSATSEKSARWYKKDPEFDDLLRQRFGSLHEELLAGQHAGWSDNPHSAIAAVVVLDQFSRNMFRGTAKMFAADDLALGLAKSAIGRGFDRKLPKAMRSFFYMPLMHSESLADQEQCVVQFRDLEGSSDEYAVRHRDIVARFGRFPHRNETLGRESTPEELTFLKEPGSSF